MQLKKFISYIITSLSFLFLYAQPNPNNLFLVEVENVYNAQMAGKILDRPSMGERSWSTEEILMYDILNCKNENGQWIRYTANSNGKGKIKVGHPFMQSNGNRIFFVSNINGGAGGFDVYYSEKRNGQWSDPTNLGLKVNSSEDELFPFVTDANILQIYRGSTQVNFDLNQILDINDTKVPAITNQNVSVNTNTVTTNTPTNETKPLEQVTTTPATASTSTNDEKIEAKVESTPIATNEIIYRVQVGAYSKPNWTILNPLKSFGEFNTMTNSNGLTAVHVGTFSNLNDAKVVARQIQQRQGFGNAYVVEIKDGQVVGIYR
ncbi:MAG: SPOR domain-containing protein [Chitinophagales bacterium]|nr:SPOR domain-containing protein [Chitinophagales bacterium]